MSCNILHVVPAFYPSRGGIEVLLENLTESPNLDSTRTHAILAPRHADERPDDFKYGRTHVFSIDSPGPEDYRQFEPGLRPRANEQREIARMLLRVRALIAKAGPQILHIHGLSVLGIAAAISADSLKIPIVVHLHGDVTKTLSAHMKTRIRTAQRVIAVSLHVKDSIVQETGRVEGVHVIRNGLPDPLPETNGYAKNTSPVITMVGRLEVSKGFDQGLRACAPLLEQFKDVRINIVGVGVEEAALKDLTRSLGLERNVTFHGRLERGDTLKLLRSTTCSLVPSLAYEGFSLVALESAYLETPVVAYHTGGLPETIIDGQTGVIVPPADIRAMTDALREYLANPDLAQTHGSHGRNRALIEFTIERMTSHIDAIHDQLLIHTAPD